MNISPEDKTLMKRPWYKYHSTPVSGLDEIFNDQLTNDDHIMVSNFKNGEYFSNKIKLSELIKFIRK